jgi:hypothetical protein
MRFLGRARRMRASVPDGDNDNVGTRRSVLYCSLAIVAGVSATLASLAHGESAPRTKAVTCSERISFANWWEWKPPRSYRIILGRVALPREEVTYARPRGDPTDSVLDFSKQGVAIRRAKGSVHLSVPADWRGRFAIGWGFRQRGQFDAISFPGRCAKPPAWSVYAGGFYVLEPGCVPMNIRVGRQRRRVWLGVGEECPPQHMRAAAARGARQRAYQSPYR